MQPEPSGEVAVTIRIARDQLARFDDIVRLLQQLGLANAAPHARFGIVNGSLPADRLAEARRVSGVASVQEDRTYRAQGR
jgi:hypothetical protein